MTIDQLGPRFRSAMDGIQDSQRDVDEAMSRFTRTLLRCDLVDSFRAVRITLPIPVVEPKPPTLYERLFGAKPMIAPKAQDVYYSDRPFHKLVYVPSAVEPHEAGIYAPFAFIAENEIEGFWPSNYHGPRRRFAFIIAQWPDLTYEHVTSLILRTIEERVAKVEQEAATWATRRVSTEVEAVAVERAEALRR